LAGSRRHAQSALAGVAKRYAAVRVCRTAFVVMLPSSAVDWHRRRTTRLRTMGGYGIVLRMHRLPLEEMQLSTRRADKRWLRRSLRASRGNWGSALPWISKVADRGLVWPLLGGALCCAAIHSQRRRSRDSRRCRHQRRHVGHPAGGPAGPATHVDRTGHPRVGQTAGRIILPVDPRGERLRLRRGRWHDLPRAQRCPGAIGGGDRRGPRRDRPPLSRRCRRRRPDRCRYRNCHWPLPAAQVPAFIASRARRARFQKLGYRWQIRAGATRGQAIEWVSKR